MYIGFNLTFNRESDLSSTSTYTQILEQRKTKIRESLEQFYNDEGLLDGTSLKDEWFPDIGNVQVFISHSHKDIEQAKNLANWLYDNFKLESFIDSDIWGFADNLLKKIDDNHAYNYSTGTYIYETRNYTTSHIHLMLSSALNSMIDRCECLIFLNTDNAIKNISFSEGVAETHTSSPWIMAELQTSRLIEKKESVEISRTHLACESINNLIKSADSFVMYHKINTDHLFNITCDSLKAWKNLCPREDKKYYALTHLYRKYTDFSSIHNEYRVKTV